MLDRAPVTPPMSAPEPSRDAVLEDSRSRVRDGDRFVERLRLPIARAFDVARYRVEKKRDLRYVARVDPVSGGPATAHVEYEADLVILRTEPRDLPMVFIEAKVSGTTDNALTASAKVESLRRSYPWLRSGFIVDWRHLKPLLLWHARSFDFILAVGGLNEGDLDGLPRRVIERELEYAEAGRLIAGRGYNSHREYPPSRLPTTQVVPPASA